MVFKGRRREYYGNPREIPVHVDDYVIVQAERGEDLGRIHHTNEWVKASQLPQAPRPILRTARPEDMERLDQNRAKEEKAFASCKEKVFLRDLEMKLVDCEYQWDGNRITFFFTAEKRVDFRDLVKDLAAMFRTRIELRQIGVRDEAGRIGGVGTCGRELCCSTWLREFEPITLKMAKDQGLSPSPSKISGACGRLKCCLRYELDFYKESNREFPKLGSRLTMPDGEFDVARVDIFHRTLLLRDESGKEATVLLSDVPKGTRIVGPSRDRRKGCDKNECASRGTKPGDGENPPAAGGPGGGGRGPGGLGGGGPRGGAPGGGGGGQRGGAPGGGGGQRGGAPGGGQGGRPGGGGHAGGRDARLGGRPPGRRPDGPPGARG